MNIMHALHQLLNQPTHAGGPVFPNNQPLQAHPGGTLIQGRHLGGRVQLQNTNNNSPMGEAVQNAGGGMVEGLAAPDAASGYMGGGNVRPQGMIQAEDGSFVNPAFYQHHALRQLIHGGSPQGFASDFAASGYPEANMQQPAPMQIQGVQNPGLIPMQGSRGVRNPQSGHGRSGNISF